jgi:NADH:ubiquinone oxidoreductase subunit F (NADH-binding)/(2Fe-2S) ferredoxin
VATSFNEIQNEAKGSWSKLVSSDIPLVRIGTAICGHAAGAIEILEALRIEINRLNLQVNVQEVGCIGLCYAEPLLDIQRSGGPRVFYKNVTPDMIPELVESALIGNDHKPESVLGSLGGGAIPGIPRLEDNRIWNLQVRVATRNCGTIDPGQIQQYIAQGGYEGVAKALNSMDPQTVRQEVATAGLRGRGGAAFPTATKWGFLAATPGDVKYVLINGEEGDPGAFNDKALLESDPHTVIEGTILAGYATGATFGYIFIRHGHDGPINRTREAIQQARNTGFLGERILGSDFSFDMEVALTGDSYVSGEETALMEAIEGKRAMPRSRPPFPAQVGLWGKPSNINNVKTVAYVPEIIRQGGEWFASIGYERSKGTAIVCVTGDVAFPGMYEVPFGMTLSQVLREMAGATTIKVLQTGGPLGGVLGPDSMDVVLDFESMARAGAILGSGGIIVGGDEVCVVDLTRNLVAFCQFESCGKCFPCRLGMTHLLEFFDRIAQGQCQPGDKALMESVGQSMALGSLCGHGQLGFNPVSSALRYFAEEFREHMENGQCSEGRCHGVFHKPSRTRPMAIEGWYARRDYAQR